MGSFIYLGASLAGAGVPNAIDASRAGALGGALLIDLLLIGVFALQHTAMARPAFKRAWTRVVPPTIERSTYVLLSALAMGLLLYGWRPLGGTIWSLEDPTARILILALYGLGWFVVVGSTFALDHFDLFGLRQVYLASRDRPYTTLSFSTPGPYRWVRHPIYVGWLLVFWVTPTMTWSHAVLAGLMTAYILVAIRFEERDLVDHFGTSYEAYRKRVPALLPGLSGIDATSTAEETATI
jgi:protein-S-isoprenylcysteine O-methyltransferase Ste14